MVNVDRPLIAVLRDNAGHYLIKRVATLAAACFKVGAAAGYHGKGLLVKDASKFGEPQYEMPGNGSSNFHFVF